MAAVEVQAVVAGRPPFPCQSPSLVIILSLSCHLLFMISLGFLAVTQPLLFPLHVLVTVVSHASQEVWASIYLLSSYTLSVLFHTFTVSKFTLSVKKRITNVLTVNV